MGHRTPPTKNPTQQKEKRATIQKSLISNPVSQAGMSNEKKMKIVVEHIKKQIESMRIDIANYYKWIAECRKNGNDYGVESYTESMNELKKELPQWIEALKILKQHK